MVQFFGIDPGGSGGIACITDEMKVIAIPMPDNESDIWKVLSGSINPEHDFAVIEEVSGYMPGEIKKGKDGSEYRLGVAPGSRMFTFGQSYGTLRMGLIASGLVEGERWCSVRPNEWQRWLRKWLEQRHRTLPNTPLLSPRNRKGGESREAYKRRLKGIAEYLFPDYRQRITLKTADAILLALYCKNQYETAATQSKTLWG